MKKLVIASLLYLIPYMTYAVTLIWDPSTSSFVRGYKVYYGTTSLFYTNSYNVGNVTNTTISNTNFKSGYRYYFAVTAYTIDAESDFSNEVSFVPTNSVPPTPPKTIRVKLY